MTTRLALLGGLALSPFLPARASACGQIDYDGCGRPTVVGVGRHLLEARTTIVGHADVLTSLSVEVDGTKPSSAVSAEIVAAEVAANPEDEQQGGCSLVESWRTSLSQIFSFTLLPLLLRSGRRRGRSA